MRRYLIRHTYSCRCAWSKPLALVSAFAFPGRNLFSAFLPLRPESNRWFPSFDVLVRVRDGTAVRPDTFASRVENIIIAIPIALILQVRYSNTRDM